MMNPYRKLVNSWIGNYCRGKVIRVIKTKNISSILYKESMHLPQKLKMKWENSI